MPIPASPRDPGQIIVTDASELACTGEAVLLDVREADEYSAGHAPGASWQGNRRSHRRLGHPRRRPDVRNPLARAGATREEAAEAIGVTFLMHGGPATIHGARAYDAFCEFAGALEAGETQA